MQSFPQSRFEPRSYSSRVQVLAKCSVSWGEVDHLQSNLGSICISKSGAKPWLGQSPSHVG